MKALYCCLTCVRATLHRHFQTSFRSPCVIRTEMMSQLLRNSLQKSHHSIHEGTMQYSYVQSYLHRHSLYRSLKIVVSWRTPCNSQDCVDVLPSQEFLVEVPSQCLGGHHVKGLQQVPDFVVQSPVQAPLPVKCVGLTPRTYREETSQCRHLK